jgi:hypothetical protein
VSNPTVKRTAKRCATCKDWFRPTQRYDVAKYCSRTCAAKGRSHASFVSAGKAGAMARYGEDSIESRLAPYRSKVDGMTPWEAFVAGVTYGQKRGRDAAYLRGKRQGVAEGWAEALGEKGQRWPAA